MKPNSASQRATGQTGPYWGVLALLGCASWLSYAGISWLGRHFTYGHPKTERPILAVLGLLGVAFACYLAAIWVALRIRDDRRLWWLIVLSSVAFRCTLLCSWPIQEVDVYRYLWDGEVGAHGISPFGYSPQQVLDASSNDSLPDDLRRLVELRDSSPEAATLLSRVHYGHLPTIYPPVSQAVFTFCSIITPRGATVFQRLVIIKALFVLFDLATLGVLIRLLRLVDRHVGWSLTYGWCPLVIKEVANSGHLDAWSVLLTVLAVAVTLRATFRRRPPALGRATLAAGLLALAVGAKLYPVVLVPLFAVTWVRRFGWRLAAAPAIVFTTIAVTVLWPMVPSVWEGDSPIFPAGKLGQSPSYSSAAPNSAAGDPAAFTRQDPSLALRTFLKRWEMNDFLFLLVVENLKPQGDVPPDERPWFSVMPESWRSHLLDACTAWVPRGRFSVAFVLTRCITTAAFLIAALVLAWRGGLSEDPLDWLRAAFLTLAWFWLLSPTQNPWYWTWALPLVAFARSRAWLAVSGLTLVYYLRFWLIYHWPEGSVLGTGYNGKLFFDFVVTWLEFAPWLLWLAMDWWRHRRSEIGAGLSE